jgi:hypothetical protein
MHARARDAPSRAPRAQRHAPQDTPHTPHTRAPRTQQVIREEAGEKFLKARIADQQRALASLKADPGLGGLQLIEGPLFDLEVRGVPALQYFGSKVWK